MKRKEEPRSRRLDISLTATEYATLQKGFSAATCQSFSEYIRALLLHKPIIQTFRSQSLDEFLVIAIGIKNEVETIRRDFSDAIKKLASSTTGARTKEAIDFLMAEEFGLREKIDAIKSTLIKMYEKWSQ
jgi:hypothetical protein